MTVMLWLIGLSLLMGGAGLVFFLWCLRSGQYDDLEGAANRILFDDPPVPYRPTEMVTHQVPPQG